MATRKGFVQLRKTQRYVRRARAGAQIFVPVLRVPDPAVGSCALWPTDSNRSHIASFKDRDQIAR